MGGIPSEWASTRWLFRVRRLFDSAMEQAGQAFDDITWDWGFTRRAFDEPGKPVYCGHVFVAEPALAY